MADQRSLRPLERCVLRFVEAGVDDSEIARRFRRRPEFVGRVVAYARLPRSEVTRVSGELRPVERRILKWRAGGADYADIGRRFHRSAGHIERIEQLVAYKVAR
jgi:hypothetical protein